MNIQLCSCADEAHRVTKTVTTLKTLTAHIKENTSIVDPTFIIDNPGSVNFNYIKVTEWGRHYFVRDITALTGNRLAVSCHVDVLSTYASGIKACEAIIDKQQGDRMTSPYIDDGSYVMTCDKVIQSYNWPNGFNQHTTIVITAGGD